MTYENGKLPQVVHTKNFLAEKKRIAFLRVLAITGNIIKAAHAVGYADTTRLNRLRHEDPVFAAEWQAALVAAGDVLESEAMRRALEGVAKPITYRGEITGHETVYSDTLLLALLKANNRAKYGDQKEIKGTINHNVGVAVIPMTATDALDWERECTEIHDEQKEIVFGPDGKVIV